MAKRPSGKLRIIGGQWRSRIVAFDPAAPVRPTPDRVRQTLFDWLAPVIEGARCLDLFAGSGALGLEALSRGAAHVTFVDSSSAQCASIRAALARLGGDDRAEVRNEDALEFLRLPVGAPHGRDGVGTMPIAPMGRSYDSVVAPFDIAFLDPPFDAELLLPVLQRLPARLKPGHRAYLEWHRREPLAVPVGWTKIREKKAGQVSYALATYTGATA